MYTEEEKNEVKELSSKNRFLRDIEKIERIQQIENIDKIEDAADRYITLNHLDRTAELMSSYREFVKIALKYRVDEIIDMLK